MQSFVASRSYDIHLCEINLVEKAAVLPFVVTVSFHIRIFKFSNSNNNRRKKCSLQFKKFNEQQQKRRDSIHYHPVRQWLDFATKIILNLRRLLERKNL